LIHSLINGLVIMDLPFPCSDIVKEILSYWEEITIFVAENVKTWRTAKNVLSFSQPLADNFYEKFRNSREAEILKDKYFSTWGSIGIKAEGRDAWYFPYPLIELIIFSVKLEDITAELAKVDTFVDLPIFIDAVTRLASAMSVNFKTREIDVLRIMVMSTLERESGIGIPSFSEVALSLNISHTQARNYWTNLDKFFRRVYSLIMEKSVSNLFLSSMNGN